MSREIKFRVWSKHYEEMFYSTDFKDEDEETMRLTLGGKLMGKFKHTGVVDCSEEYLVDQFTGLRDNNGKEIYEGDIVENRNDRGPVVFEGGNFFIKPVITLRPGQLRLMGTIYWDTVVGNIHQNFELLISI